MSYHSLVYKAKGLILSKCTEIKFKIRSKMVTSFMTKLMIVIMDLVILIVIEVQANELISPSFHPLYFQPHQFLIPLNLKFKVDFLIASRKLSQGAQNSRNQERKCVFLFFSYAAEINHGIQLTDAIISLSNV